MRVVPWLMFLVLSASTAYSSEHSKLKDGRHYVLEVAKLLQIPAIESSSLFRDNRANLPRKGNLKEFSASNISLAKVASRACEYVDDFEGDYLTIDQTYQMILDRSPTEIEKQNMILKGDKFSFFATCFSLLISPEFIFVKR